MSAQVSQMQSMTAAELILYGRRSHSIIVWELISLELERRLATRD